MDGHIQVLTSFVSGPTDGPTVTEYSGRQFGLQVDLAPLTLGRLLGPLVGRPITLEDAFGADAHRLADQTAGAPDWSTRFDCVDRFLRQRLADAGEPTAAISWAVRRLESSGGRIRVGALVRETGWSRRHFIELFQGAMGITPGRYARLLRFSRALRFLEAGDALAAVAVDAGYYDQAHMDRDFGTFCGRPPTELVARRLPDGFGVAG